MNLSKKMIISVVTLLVLVASTLGLTAYYFSSKALIKTSEEGLVESTALGAKEVASTIGFQLDILQEVANQSEVQDASFSLSRRALEGDVERLGYLDMALVKEKGTASYVLENTSKNLGDRPYVIEAFKGHKNVSDLLISSVTGEPVLMYAVPVYLGDYVQKVLVARRDGNSLNDVTDSIGFGDHGYAYIIDHDGVTIAHPNRDLVMSQFNVIEAGQSDDAFEDVARVLKKAVKGSADIDKYTYDGKNLYASYTPIEGTPWILVNVADEGEVLSGLDAMKFNIFIVALLMILVGVVIAVVLSLSIVKPIGQLSEEILMIASYDLSDSPSDHNYEEKKDEVGTIARSVNTLREELKTLVKGILNQAHAVASSSEELTATSDQSASASEEVARAIEDIANGATEQAKETAQGVDNINDFGNIVSEEVALVSKLKDAAFKVEALKNEGFEVLKELKEKTDDNVASTKKVHTIILATDESAEKIESANVMIQSIADQTSLLALNAAIEAARAGETGRGFAVVAEEIRKLAEQSNTFADEISLIIKSLLTKTDEAVQMMNQSEEITQGQMNSLKDTNDKFEGIAEAVDEVKDISDVLDEFSTTMMGKKDDLHQMIESLSSVSQQNAAGTEEASASVEEQTAAMAQIADASEELSKLAEGMQEDIMKFKL